MPSAVKLLILCVAVTVVFMQFVEPELGQVPVSSEEAVRKDIVKDTGEVFRGYEELIQIPRSRDGHYWVDLSIQGSSVRFMVDTGASQTTLSYKAAQDIGFMSDDLIYDQPVRTANGVTRMANITLNNMSLGSIELYEVPVIVAGRGQMSVSLLGMSFLNRLKSFEFREGQLILRP